MRSLALSRRRQKLSQRALARLSGVSYKTLQLVEHEANTSVSTLEDLARGLGYSNKVFHAYLENFFLIPKDSIAMASHQVVLDGKNSWKIPLFNFVDAFLQNPSEDLVKQETYQKLPHKLKAIFAATVESLCDRHGLQIPAWCFSVFSLKEPWFVSGSENLKAMALVQSPVHFRKRNVFVLDNFLERR